MKATLPPNTLVQAIDVDPDVIGRVLRLARDADEYGDEEYVVQWPSGQEDLRHRHDLTVWPQPSVFNVRAMADDVGLSYLHGQTDEELVRWFLECLKRRYDEASEISRALPYANQPTLQRIQNLLASVDAAREEVKVARARAEEARLELEALRQKCSDLAMRPPMKIHVTSEGEARMVMESAFARTLRVVAAKDVAPTDWVWGYIEDTGAGWDHPEVVLSEEETPWLRSQNLHSYTVPHIVGPDPKLLLGEK